MAQDAVEGATRRNRRTGEVQTYQGGQWITTTPGQQAPSGGQGYQIQPMVTPAEQRQREADARNAEMQQEQLRLDQAAEVRAQAEFEREMEEARREQTASADEDAIRQAAQDDIFRRTDLVIETLTQAIEATDSSTAGVGSVFSAMPGSRARDLDAMLETIRGNTVLEELQRLKEASSTGASGLGQVTEREIALLSAVQGALDQGQSPEQLRQVLSGIRGDLWEARNTRLQAMGQEPIPFPDGSEGQAEIELVSGPEGGGDDGIYTFSINGVNVQFRGGTEDQARFSAETWGRLNRPGAPVQYYEVDGRQVPATSEEAARAYTEARYNAPDPEAAADAERRLESVPGALRQFNQGATFGLGDEIDARGAQLETMGSNAVRRLFGQEIPYTSQQAYDAVVDANRRGDEQFVERYPVTSLGANILGGIVAPGAAGLGRYVGSADNVLSGLGRGAAVGGGTGFAYGVGTGEGNLVDRAGQAVPEAVTGAALGGPLGAVVSRSGGPRRARDVETLINEGVMLTPGVERGGAAQAAETIGARMPIIGPAIRGAWQRSGDSLERAGWNRSLSPVGEALPEESLLGSDAVRFARERIGQEFDRAASLVPDGSAADDAFNNAIQRLRARAAQELGGEELAAFNRELNNRIARINGEDITFSGPALRQIDREIGELAHGYTNSQNPAQQPLGRLLGETQDEIRNLMGRLSPEARQTLDRANPAWRQYLVMERAVQRGGGTPMTPARFSQAVSDVSGGVGTNAVARDTAPLGDLGRASWVMRQTMGDSGSADAIAGPGLALWAWNEPVSGAATLGALGAGALAYSRMGQRIAQQLPRNAGPEDVTRASQQIDDLIRQAPAEERTALQDIQRQLWARAGNVVRHAGQGSQALTGQYGER